MSSVTITREPADREGRLDAFAISIETMDMGMANSVAKLLGVAFGEAPDQRQATLSALADCERTLRRIAKRAAVVEGFERFEIRQINGPNVEFTGRLLCETSFADRREGNQVTLEVYETQGGAMVAVRAFERSDGGESEAATIVKPMLRTTHENVGPSGGSGWMEIDHEAMRLAVMDAFGWRTEAKAMVRKKLGWDLRVEID